MRIPSRGDAGSSVDFVFTIGDSGSDWFGELEGTLDPLNSRVAFAGDLGGVVNGLPVPQLAGQCADASLQKRGGIEAEPPCHLACFARGLARR